MLLGYRVHDVIKPRRVARPINRHHIYSNVFSGVTQRNRLSQLPKFALLAVVNHFNRSAKEGAGLGLDFNNHDRRTILRQNINLTEFQPQVTAENFQTITLQQVGCQVLRLGSQRALRFHRGLLWLGQISFPVPLVWRLLLARGAWLFLPVPF